MGLPIGAGVCNDQGIGSFGGAEGSGYSSYFAVREGSPAGSPAVSLCWSGSLDARMQKERSAQTPLAAYNTARPWRHYCASMARERKRLTPWVISATSVSGPRDHDYRLFPGIPARYMARRNPWPISKILRWWLQWSDNTILGKTRVVLFVTSLINSVDANALSLKRVVVMAVRIGTLEADVERRGRCGAGLKWKTIRWTVYCTKFSGASIGISTWSPF